jgi:EF-P beta-lysylation protein EpmB
MARLWQTPAWQRELNEAFTSPSDLLAHLGLPGEPGTAAEQARCSFAMRVPRGFAALMEHGNANDPLLRQVLPSGMELELAPGFTKDPVGDAGARAAPGLLRKYRGRALLLTTAKCAGHCRYCFRRHRPAFERPTGDHATVQSGPDGWDAALYCLARAADVDEVILSGGDPLMLDDDALAGLIARLDGLPQLRRLRLHTRVPVLLPSRLTSGLLKVLTSTRLTLVVVCHINHPREIGKDAAAALSRLRPVAAALLNQSVLLAGVNDSPETLIDLSQTLFAHGVLPYYLHQLDRVQGAAHFEVPDARALHMITGLRERLPGYLVPRLVRELPGALCKEPVAEGNQRRDRERRRRAPGR